MSTRHYPSLDTLDIQLMKELESDANQTYNNLASKLNINRLTVANKVRRLFDNDVIKIMCLADPVALGYNVASGFRICAQPGQINKAADRLADCTQISHVYLVTGYCDIIAWCQFRNREELSNFITNELGTIPGLQHVETQLVLNQVKMFPMLLANDKEPPRLNNMAHHLYDLDDLDLKLIKELQRDARQKPVNLAQKFGVSDTTILRRSQRLVNKQIIRIMASINPFALGYEGVAIIMLKCDMDKEMKVIEAVAAYKNVPHVFISTGQYTISILVVFHNLNNLWHFIDVELRSIPGLRDIDTMIIHKMVKTSTPYPL